MTEPKKRGRPRKNPEPPPPAEPILVMVCDRRFNPRREVGSGGMHPNTPGDWTRAEILGRYGIAEHLHVVIRDQGGNERVIQQGATAP